MVPGNTHEHSTWDSHKVKFEHERFTYGQIWTFIRILLERNSILVAVQKWRSLNSHYMILSEYQTNFSVS